MVSVELGCKDTSLITISEPFWSDQERVMKEKLSPSLKAKCILIGYLHALRFLYPFQLVGQQNHYHHHLLMLPVRQTSCPGISSFHNCVWCCFVYVGSLAASLASTYYIPIAPPICDNPKYLQPLLNIPWWGQNTEPLYWKIYVHYLLHSLQYSMRQVYWAHFTDENSKA